ncbi:MAG: hypothetical protein HN521_25385 [Candidatus Latescibacteria bacterium]|nr:hypothetical protein [Candidatus Latescibacterota bacterium]MBT5833042.1 hypothetical protein [Candidatus Latescibacterota bacterium]
MKIPHLLWKIFLFFYVAAPIQTTAQTTTDPKFYFSGIVDLTTPFSQEGAPLTNQYRRGDSPFDKMRATLFGDIVLAPRLTLFNQTILDPTSRAHFQTYWRPILQFDALQKNHFQLLLEAGKLATTFGSYSPRAYSNRSPLISPPLMYHYFTSLRSNQLPANNDDLLKSRGQGNSSIFSGFGGGGGPGFSYGLPIIYDVCWDTGIRAFGSLWRLEYSLALTQGALSDPVINGNDTNSGKQIVSRIGLIPATGLFIGSSYARGAYLNRIVATALPVGQTPEDYVQEVIGFDLNYEVRHLKLVAEVLFNTWEIPNIVDNQNNPKSLAVLGWYAEARYAFLPGFYGAVRVDQLKFEKIENSAGQSLTWDDDIWRLEGGIGYQFWEGVLGKLIVQDVHKKRTPRTTFGAAQLSLSF